jgi:tetratricopeptide (TPR) repeat protein
MGEVYEAYDPRLGRDVAVKVVRHLEGVDKTELVARFQREARAVGRLRHSGIVSVYDVGDHDGLPYLVMERLEGETLRTRLTRGPVPTEEALGWFRQACSALAAAHAAGLVHRDIKPENLFLASEGQLKILDFGLAKDTRPAGDDESTHLATRTGAVLGTLGYLSPEQARGETVDARADVFALGAVLLELLTGRPAFARATPVATLSAILTEDPVPASGVPDALKPLLSACLAKDSSQRLADAGAILRALEQTPGAAPSRRKPRPIGLAAAGAAALLLLGAGGLAWVRRTRPAATPVATASQGWEALQAARYLDQRTPVKELEGKSLAEDPVVQAYQAALAKDPGLTEADLGLASHLINRVFWNRKSGSGMDLAPAAFVSLSKVLAKDPRNVEALVLRSNLSFTPDAGWRMDEALDDVLAAMRLEPHNPKALGSFGSLCEHMGLAAEGYPALEEVLKREPNNLDMGLTLARLRAQDLDPRAAEGYEAVPPGMRLDWALALERQGRGPEAEAFLKKYLATLGSGSEFAPGDPVSSDFMVFALQSLLQARRGRSEEALRLASESEKIGKDLTPFHHASYVLACTYAALHRPAEALRHLQYCADHGYPCFTAFQKDPLLDPLRATAGFQAFQEAQRFAAEARRKRIAAVRR